MAACINSQNWRNLLDADDIKIQNIGVYACRRPCSRIDKPILSISTKFKQCLDRILWHSVDVSRIVIPEYFLNIPRVLPHILAITETVGRFQICTYIKKLLFPTGSSSDTLYDIIMVLSHRLPPPPVPFCTPPIRPPPPLLLSETVPNSVRLLRRGGGLKRDKFQNGLQITTKGKNVALSCRV